MDDALPQPVTDVFDYLEGMVSSDVSPACGAFLLPRQERDEVITWEGMSLVEAAHASRAIASASVCVALLAEPSGFVVLAADNDRATQRGQAVDGGLNLSDCATVRAASAAARDADASTGTRVPASPSWSSAWSSASSAVEEDILEWRRVRRAELVPMGTAASSISIVDAKIASLQACIPRRR